MKFYLGSDLHLSHGNVILENEENVEVLILAGDIFEFSDLGKERYRYVDDFLMNTSGKFKRIYWIPGNHEYYNSHTMSSGRVRAREYLAHIGCHNIQILNNQTIIDELPIHCTTLWTDLNKGNPLTVMEANSYMMDYTYIGNGTYDKLTPDHTMSAFQESISFLADATSDGKDCIVVTHHQPSFQGFLPQYRNDPMRFAFGTDLSNFILDRTNIKVWCAGHTHVRNEFDIGETRIITNCRGYEGYEKMVNSFKLKLIEV